MQGVNPSRILRSKFWNYYTIYIAFIMLVLTISPISTGQRLQASYLKMFAAPRLPTFPLNVLQILQKMWNEVNNFFKFTISLFKGQVFENWVICKSLKRVENTIKSFHFFILLIFDCRFLNDWNIVESSPRFIKFTLIKLICINGKHFSHLFK